MNYKENINNHLHAAMDELEAAEFNARVGSDNERVHRIRRLMDGIVDALYIGRELE